MGYPVVVGSTNEMKINAVRRAVDKVLGPLSGAGLREVRGFAAASDVNEQPEGLEETARGARSRADGAASSVQRDGLYVGIENGIVPIGIVPTGELLLGLEVVDDLWVDLAVVHAELWVQNRAFVGVGTSTGVVFPTEYVEEARARPGGFTRHTVGSVIAERLGGDPQDPHSTLTNGRLKRVDTLVPAVVAALSAIERNRAAQAAQ